MASKKTTEENNGNQQPAVVMGAEDTVPTREQQAQEERQITPGITFDKQGELQVNALYLASLARNTANAMFIQKEYERACSAYAQVLKLIEEEESLESIKLRVDLWSNMASCFLEMGDYSQAIICCNLVLEKEPDHMKALFRRAIALNRVVVTKRMMLPDHQSDLYQAHDDLQKAAKLYKAKHGNLDKSIVHELAMVQFRLAVEELTAGEKRPDPETLKPCLTVVRPDSINFLFEKMKASQGDKLLLPRYVHTGVPGLLVVENVLTQQQQEKLVEICETLKKDCESQGMDLGFKGPYKHDRLITYASDWAFAQHFDMLRNIESQMVGVSMSLPFIDLDRTLVAINWYRPGEGLEPHVDSKGLSGGQVVGFSLLAPCVMTFEHVKTGEKREVLLKPGCAMVQFGEARSMWKHGFEEGDPNTPVLFQGKTPIERGYRISVSFSIMDDEALKKVREEDQRRIAANKGAAEMIKITDKGASVVLVQYEPGAESAAEIISEAQKEKASNSTTNTTTTTS